jgi:hypothetical protein
LFIALNDRNDIAADGTGDLNEHQTDGAAAEDSDSVADFDASLMQSAQDAGQRLGHGGIFEAYFFRDDQHVGLNDAARNADVFGVGSVVEQQIFAEIFLMLRAIEAHLAGCGIERDHAHTLPEAVDAFTDLFHDSSEFVAKESGRNNHAGVIAALVHLEIGSAGEGDLNFDENFPLIDPGDGHSFNFDIFFAVQDGGGHFSVHLLIPSQLNDPMPHRAELRFSSTKAAGGRRVPKPARFPAAETGD